MFTINTSPIHFVGKIEITNKLTVKLHINDFNLNIESITNSNVGEIDVGFIKLVLKLFEPIIKDVINLVFSRGIDCSWVLKVIGLDFIQFEKTLLVPMNRYFLFFVTPIFKLDLLDGRF